MIKGFVIALLSTLFLLLPTNTSAHVLQYSGSIGAVLHVNPEDDPIAGDISNFFFEFKDKKNKFIPANCDCKAKILKDGKEIYSQDLFKDNTNPSLTNISFSYTFPTIGIYSIVVDGKARDSSFEDFNLKYDVRVARGVSNVPTPISSQSQNWFLTHKVHIVLPCLLGIIIIFFYFNSRKKK